MELEKYMLNKASEKVSFLYVEYAHVKETAFSVQIVQERKSVEIPIAALGCLIFGPGTTVTHGAVKMCAECGCSIVWMGNGCQYLYAQGTLGTNSSKNILLQMRYHENKTLHLEVVHKMYGIRYPDEKIKSKSLEELRGCEGKHVKELYQKLAEEHNIEWSGRSYKTTAFDEQDEINKCLTWCNQFLYAISKSIINYLGFSPSIGFIHTGNINSFVYDIADLYKEKISIPAAFETANSSEDIYHGCRLNIRKKIEDEKFLKNICSDLLELFPKADGIPDEIYLWDYNGIKPHGTNYGNMNNL